MKQSERDFRRIIDAYYDPIVKEAEECPFCHGTFLALAEWEHGRIIPRPTWRIFCVSCKTLGPIGDSKQMAVDFWNRKYERLTLTEFHE